jgi:hypothetical protein
MDIKTKRILAFIFLTFFIIGTAEANIIATIGMEGLNMISPEAGKIIDTIICAQNPIVCLSGKVMGIVQSKLMETLAETSPKIYKAVSTYNEIKSYIEQGASILEELKINEEGNIEGGVISFGEEENSIKKLFIDSNTEDIAISNADYDFETQKITLKEGGYLKVKVKDDEGKIQELNYENIAEGYLKLNESTGLVEEAEIVTSGDSTYKFGEYESLSVKEGTHILYQDGKITVSGKENNFMYGNLNISSFEESVNLFGDKIICAECSINEIKLKGLGKETRGILEQTDKGYLIKYGEATYKQNLLTVDTKNEEVLIADLNADLSDYQGSWLKQTSENLEIKSSESGSINLEILEEHDIFNTDAKDKLNIKLTKGDGLNIEKRADEGLIPKVIYASSTNEGASTEIENDHLKFSFKDGEFYMSPPKSVTRDDLFGKYQSVALELESDSAKEASKIRVNSYNQFIMLGKDNNELVSYNKYDLPVSSKIKDNELQTIEQLREKYPEMLFTTPSEKETMPPYMFYLTDIYIQENPEALDEMKGWHYDLGTSASVVYFNTFIGLEIVQTDSPNNFEEIRKFTSPLQVFVHEHEHIKDNIIIREENKIINSKQDSLQKKYDELGENCANRLSQSKTKTLLKDFFKNINDDKITPTILKSLEEKKDYSEELMTAYSYLVKTPDLKSKSNDFDRIIQLSTGLPSGYSLDYFLNYREISTTYREQPIEQRKLLVQSGNKLISETYTKLTQLAFDSGKMKTDEFVAIMGNGFCKKGDCSDKICKEYKLLCCEDNPSSPNC